MRRICAPARSRRSFRRHRRAIDAGRPQRNQCCHGCRTPCANKAARSGLGLVIAAPEAGSVMASILEHRDERGIGPQTVEHAVGLDPRADALGLEGERALELVERLAALVPRRVERREVVRREDLLRDRRPRTRR